MWIHKKDLENWKTLKQEVLLKIVLNDLKKQTMEAKKRGRKKLEPAQKVTMVSVYLRQCEKEAIVAKYGSVTNAVREEVVQKLETPKLANL
jgi:hypothetical protein